MQHAGSRRRTAAAIAVATVTAVLTHAAPASAGDFYEATITWPDPTTLHVLDEARVTVDGTGTTRTLPVQLIANEYETDERVVEKTSISPDEPIATIDIPTDAAGVTDYVVHVGADGRYGASQETITVLGQPSTVTGSVPAGTYRAGARGRTVSGTVTGTVGRPVTIEARATNGTWTAIARTRSREDHTFSLPIPTTWVGRHRLRVAAPATDLDLAAVSSAAPQVVTVTRTYRPRPGRAFTFTDTFNHSRWDPCVTHPYRLNPRHAWAGFRKDVRTVFDAITEATGLRFAYAGATTHTPYVSKSRSGGPYPEHTDFVVAWSTPKLAPMLRGPIGWGGSSYTSVDGGAWQRFQGEVLLDGTFDPRPYRGVSTHEMHLQLLAHELGHAIGLGHVDDVRQDMYPSMQWHSWEYGAGDLRGLEKLGAAQGCLPVVPGSARGRGTAPVRRTVLR